MKKTILRKTLLGGLMCSMLFVTACGCGQTFDAGDPLAARGRPKYILNETANQARLSDENFIYYHIGTTSGGKAKYAAELKESIITSSSSNYAEDYGTLVVPDHVGTDTNTVVTGIWRGAFKGCRSTTVTLPSTITVIDYEAFLYSDITSITIPYSVEEIGEGAFYACPNLTTVLFENDNGGASSAGAITCACDQTESGSTPVYCTLQTIPAFCFFKCTAMTTLTLPASIATVEYEAFNGCKNLSSDIYFQSIRTIRSRAFQSCVSLHKVYISRSLFKKDNQGNTGIIEKHAFNFCDPTQLEIHFCGGKYTEVVEQEVVEKDEIDEWLKDADNKMWGWYDDVNDPYDSSASNGLSTANNLTFIKESGDIYYTQEWTFTTNYNETDHIYDVTISKYNGTRDNIKFLSVPDSMALTVANRVTRINADAFDKEGESPNKIKTNLERLYLSKHLVAIENSMFSGFQELFVVDSTSACADDWNAEKADQSWTATGRIDLSDLTELKYIGERAFCFMGKNDSVREKVEQIHLPANLIAVGAEAFGCQSYAYGNNPTNHYIFKNVTSFEWDYDDTTSRLESVGHAAFFKLGVGSYASDAGAFNRIRENYPYVAHETSRIIFPRTFQGFGMTPDQISAYESDGFTFTTVADGTAESKPQLVFGACPLIKEVIFKGSKIDQSGNYVLNDGTANLRITAQTFANCSSLETVIFEERVNCMITFHTQKGAVGLPAIGSNAGRYGNDFRGDPTLQTIILPNVYTKLRFQDLALQGNSRAALYLTGTLNETLKTITESNGVQTITDTENPSIVGENTNETPYTLADNTSTPIANIKQWCTIGDESFYTASSASSSAYYGYVYNSTESTQSNGYVNSFGIDQKMPIYERIHYIEQINTGTQETPVMKTIAEAGKAYDANNNPHGQELVFDGKFAYVCSVENAKRVATMSKYRLNAHDSDLDRTVAHVPGKVTYGGNDYIVTKIGDSAFSAAYCDLTDGSLASDVLATVELPDSIEEIGDYAFLRAYGVTKISAYPVNASGVSTGSAVDYNMPANLELIGKNAFTFCNVIQFLNIPYECLFYENANDTYDVASVFTNDLSLRKITFRDANGDAVNQLYSAYYMTTTYDEDTGVYLSGTFGGVNHWYGSSGIAYDERYNLQLPEVEDNTYSHIIKNVYLEQGDSFKVIVSNGQGGFAWYGDSYGLNDNGNVTIDTTGYYDIKLSKGSNPRVSISSTAEADRDIIHAKTTALYSTEGALELITSNITANNGSNSQVTDGLTYISNERNNGNLYFKELENDAGYQYYVESSSGQFAVTANLSNVTLNGGPITNVSGYYLHIWNSVQDTPFTWQSDLEKFNVNNDGIGTLTMNVQRDYSYANFSIKFNDNGTNQTADIAFAFERDRAYVIQVGALTVDNGTITSGVTISLADEATPSYAPTNEEAKYYVRVGDSKFIPLVVNQNATLGNGVAQEYMLADDLDFKVGDALRFYKLDTTKKTPYNANRLLLVLNRDADEIYLPSREVAKVYDQNSYVIGIEFDGEYPLTNHGTVNPFLFGAYKMGYWISYLNLGPSTYINNDSDDGVLTQVLFSAIVDRSNYESGAADIIIYLNKPISQYVDVSANSFDNAKRDLISISGDIFNVAGFAFSGCDRLAQIYFKYKAGGVIPDGVFNGSSNANLIYTTPGSTPGSVINTDIAHKGILDLSNSGYVSIGFETFYDNDGLVEFDVSKGVSTFTIGESAFEKSSNLASVDLSGVTDTLTIGKKAFYGTKIGQGQGATFTSPTSTSLSIGESAFEGQSGLTAFDFTYATDSLIIGKSAFRNTGLTSFTAPAVEDLTISANSFENCKSLQTIDFSNVTGTLTIDASAFHGDTALTRIIWPTDPDTHIVIKGNAFQGCTSLQYAGYDDQSIKFVFHNNTTSIGTYAFDGCSSIVDIVLPNKLGNEQDARGKWNTKTLGQYAFQNCTSLKTVDVDGENPYQMLFDRYTFNGCENLESFAFEKFTFTGQNPENNRYGFQIYRYGFTGCTSLGSTGDRTLVIPENYILLGVDSFSGTSYEHVVFEGAVIEIAGGAFLNCTSLKTVEFTDPACQWKDATEGDNFGKEIFKGCTSLESLYLPTGFSLSMTSTQNVDMVKGDTAPVVIYTHHPNGTTIGTSQWRTISTPSGQAAVLAKVVFKITALNQAQVASGDTVYFWVDDEELGFLYLGEVESYTANDRAVFDSGYVYLNDGTIITKNKITAISDVLTNGALTSTTIPYYMTYGDKDIVIVLGTSTAYDPSSSPQTVIFSNGYVLRSDGYLVTSHEISVYADALTNGALTDTATKYWATISGTPTIIGEAVAYDATVGVLFADGHLINTSNVWTDQTKEITNGVSDTLTAGSLTDTDTTVYWIETAEGKQLLGYSLSYVEGFGVFFSAGYLLEEDGTLIKVTEITNSSQALDGGVLITDGTNYWFNYNSTPTIIGTAVSYGSGYGVFFSNGYVLNGTTLAECTEINAYNDVVDQGVVDTTSHFWIDSNSVQTYLGTCLAYQEGVGSLFSNGIFLKADGTIVAAAEVTDSSDTISGGSLKDQTTVYWMEGNPKVILGESLLYSAGTGVLFANGYILNGTDLTANAKLISSYTEALNGAGTALADTNTTNYYFYDAPALISLGHSIAYDSATGVLFFNGSNYLLKIDGTLARATYISNSSAALDNNDQLIDTDTTIYWSNEESNAVILGYSTAYYSDYGVFFSNGYCLNGTTLTHTKVISSISEALNGAGTALADTDTTVYLKSGTMEVLGHSIAYNAKVGVLFDTADKVMDINGNLVSSVEIQSIVYENDTLKINGMPYVNSTIYWKLDSGNAVLLGTVVLYQGAPMDRNHNTYKHYRSFTIASAVLFSGDKVYYLMDEGTAQRAGRVFDCIELVTVADISGDFNNHLTTEYWHTYGGVTAILGRPIWYESGENSINFEYRKVKKDAGDWGDIKNTSPNREIYTLYTLTMKNWVANDGVKVYAWVYKSGAINSGVWYEVSLGTQGTGGTDAYELKGALIIQGELNTTFNRFKLGRFSSDTTIQSLGANNFNGAYNTTSEVTISANTPTYKVNFS